MNSDPMGSFGRIFNWKGGILIGNGKHEFPRFLPCFGKETEIQIVQVNEVKSLTFGRKKVEGGVAERSIGL